MVVLLVVEGELIETTPEHPFYEISEWDAWGNPFHTIAPGTWVDAENLTPGDTLVRANGSFGTVGNVEIVGRTQRMYNFTVDKAHTYFITDDGWLVHNCPDGETGSPSRSTSNPFMPYVPNGWTFSEFGDLIGWERSTQAAWDRIDEIGWGEIQDFLDAGVDSEMIWEWYNFYEYEAGVLNPNNPSALGRRDLMEHIFRMMDEIE